ncbi:hypothetical protein [Streptomyces spongiicola]|uniref:hypothetical protein n=1 Tax=Streptomyces spongiicola TaxID=1690221 RepID=UPI0013A5A06F|nr:hypothetical protein [Streptomyces spongiicola]
MDMQAEPGRDFWGGVPASGGFTAVPRWVAGVPVPGSGTRATNADTAADTDGDTDGDAKADTESQPAPAP